MIKTIFILLFTFPLFATNQGWGGGNDGLFNLGHFQVTSADSSAGGFRIIQLNDPSAATDAANLEYVGYGILTYERVVATNGGNHTITNNNPVLALHESGTIAGYTVTMPAAPQDGQQQAITSDHTITAFTLSPNTSQTIIGAPTTLVVGSSARFIWIATDSEWYPF